MIPQKSLAGKSFATMFTNQRLCSNVKCNEVSIHAVHSTYTEMMWTEVIFSPTGSACLCKWSNSFVLLENMLPHVGQATSLSWVWLRMCSLRRYLILKKASQPVTETWNIDNADHARAGEAGHTMSLLSRYLSSGRREPAVLVRETLAQHFQHDCPHVGKTTQDY